MDITGSIEIIKALSDNSRLRLLNSLIERPYYVEELAHRLNLAPSTVSFHLKKLEAAGLVKPTKEQYYIIYKIDDELFGLTLKELIHFDNIEKFLEDGRTDNYRRKVVKTFFKNGRLVRLPVQRKKQLIVLEEFACKFKPGKMYTEDNVNQIIKQSYDDYCTIRRLLIEVKKMKRDKQIYRLIQN